MMANKQDTLVPIKHDIDEFVRSQFLLTMNENITISLKTLSDKNRMDYQKTFVFWSSFCDRLDCSQYDFDLVRVEAFLTENNWSFSTRKVRLAHLRKYAEILAMSDKNDVYGYSYNFHRLNLLKPKSLGGNRDVLPKKSLTSKQIYQIFDCWDGSSNKAIRNSAILGLMILGGLRASEVVALKWLEIDHDKNRILVSHGKGDKSLYIPILGDLLSLLDNWQLRQSEYGKYEYICSQIFRSGNLANDKKCTTRIISTIVSDTSIGLGFPFTPHDTRRTIITLLFDSGASVAQVRDFARHKSGETTLLYSQKSSASKLGVQLNSLIRFGDVLGAKNHSKLGRIWECGNAHKFTSINPIKCPICGNDNLSVQLSLFDE